MIGSLRMLLRLLAREPALAAQLLDQRVVAGQLAQLAVAHQVRAAVADVHDRHLVVGDQRAGQRRAHAAAARSPLAPARRSGGWPSCATRASCCSGLPSSVRSLEGLRRDLRRDLAGLRAAHPVRDREDRRAREVGVLVGAPLAPGVGARRLVDDPQHDSAPDLYRLSGFFVIARTGTPCRRCGSGRSAAAPAARRAAAR